MSELTLEVNTAFQQADDTLVSEGGGRIGRIMITPPLDEDYWLFRVKLSSSQSIVGFPKFATIGIGFARETDWNTNLPYTCDAEQIYAHIKHNKADEHLTDEECIKAIQLIQEEVRRIAE